MNRIINSSVKINKENNQTKIPYFLWNRLKEVIKYKNSFPQYKALQDIQAETHEDFYK